MTVERSSIDERFHRLVESDAQFGAALPIPEVDKQRARTELGLAQVLAVCMEGYGPIADVEGVLLEDQIRARRARPPTIWGYLSQLAAVAGWSSYPWLHHIGAPTLVLSGGRDPIVPPINARILARRIPDSTLQIVPDAGHLLLMEHATSCASAIHEFLTDVRS
jgi:pimeloyl-ACP methyl ester carboxylesterase